MGWSAVKGGVIGGETRERGQVRSPDLKGFARERSITSFTLLKDPSVY